MEMYFVNGWIIVGSRGSWEIMGSERGFRRLSEAKMWCNGNTPKESTSGLNVIQAMSGESAGPAIETEGGSP